MRCEDFVIGREFWCGKKRWRCTDVGSRVIVAICLEPHEIVTRLSGEQVGESAREIRSITDDPEWLNGPPYALPESVFDEYDIKGCSVTAEIEIS
jgi:hypothetical protein